MTTSKTLSGASLIAIFLLLTTTPVYAAAPKVFSEGFSNTKYRDSKATTALWNTADKQGVLSKETTLKVWESMVGALKFNPLSVGARGDEWLVGGAKSNLSTVLIQYGNGALKDLTSQVPSTFSGGITAIGANDDYWLLGGSAQLMKYDGTMFTDISSPDFDTALGAQSVNDIDWNGSSWLIGGTNSRVISFDGATFTDVTGDMSFGTGSVNASWNGAEWLIAGYNGNAYLYDGSAATPLSSPFASGGNIFTVYSDGDNWLLGGMIGASPALYFFDGETFQDWSSLLPPNGNVYNVGWDGQYWIMTTYGGRNSDTVWRINSDGSSARVLSYKTGARASFETDEFAQTSNGWVAVGNIINNGTSQFVVQGPQPYAKKRQLQSKAVAQFSKSWIRTVKLVAGADLPAGTSATYYVSTNGGETWKRAPSGKTLTFSTKGSRLKWRAVLTTSRLYVTPAVSLVTLTYTLKKL